MTNNQYDCIVIGGGPAGSTTATIVAAAGWSTLLVERESMPRFHVGESLMPETYWTLKRLGVLDRMQRSDFMVKRSVQFVSHKGRESEPFFFRQHDPRECSSTWQVERADFDQMLFENAREKGADCYDATRVVDAIWDGDRAQGVRLLTSDGEQREIAARVVVDATGQSTLLASRLGVRQENPALRKAAIWNYFQGALRADGENEGGTVILHTDDKRAWFWYIPLSCNVVSVGVVADWDYLLQGGKEPADEFARQLSRCPALQRRLAHAQGVDKYRVAKEFSYTTQRHAGDGWVLVGDAFGFIDPIYSSGVFFALKSGELAADAIAAALEANDPSAARLGAWTDEFLAGTRWIRKLVDAFYNNSFSVGRFIKEHPQHLGNLTDLLIGRIFHDRAGEIFGDMDPWLEAVGEQGEGRNPKTEGKGKVPG